MARDPLYTRLCEDLGIEFPIVAFTHCKDVVAEVVNAGGLAVLGEVGHSPDEIEADVKWLRGRVGNKPFGIDLLIPASVPATSNREDLEAQIPEGHKQFIERIRKEFNVPPARPRTPEEERRARTTGFLSQENARRQMEVVVENRVPVLACGLGNPAFILEAAHARGIKVFGLIGLARQAVREVEAGIDFIVATGYDAAGHTGQVGTMSLIPQVVDVAGDTPVLAAGGICSGRQLVAALAMGAVGIWTGTIWQTAKESDTDIILKQRLLEATERDTVLSRVMTGKPSRWIRSKWLEKWYEPGAPEPLPMPLQGILINDIIRSVGEHKIADLMNVPGGQGVGLIHELKPARQIVFDLMDEARGVLEGWEAVRV